MGHSSVTFKDNKAVSGIYLGKPGRHLDKYAPTTGQRVLVIGMKDNGAASMSVQSIVRNLSSDGAYHFRGADFLNDEAETTHHKYHIVAIINNDPYIVRNLITRMHAAGVISEEEKIHAFSGLHLHSEAVRYQGGENLQLGAGI